MLAAMMARRPGWDAAPGIGAGIAVDAIACGAAVEGSPEEASAGPSGIRVNGAAEAGGTRNGAGAGDAWRHPPKGSDETDDTSVGSAGAATRGGSVSVPATKATCAPLPPGAEGGGDAASGKTANGMVGAAVEGSHVAKGGSYRAFDEKKVQATGPTSRAKMDSGERKPDVTGAAAADRRGQAARQEAGTAGIVGGAGAAAAGR